MPARGGGFQGAIEMCNNNGACRRSHGGVMCPSYRVTRDERDVTRGRANTLRLAVTGQLGPDALTSDEMAQTLALCVSCKACRRECPTGVDMARMKIEVQAARVAKHGLLLHDRLVAYLPRYAPVASRLSWVANLRNDVTRLRQLSEHYAGFSARRSLPRWRRTHGANRAFRRRGGRPAGGFVRRHVQPLFRAGEHRGRTGGSRSRGSAGASAEPRRLAALRPLCCGRTFLAVGLVEEARREAERCVAALAPLVRQGIPIDRARAELRARFSRRNSGAHQKQGVPDCWPPTCCSSKSTCSARTWRVRSICRFTRLPGARCCMAIVIRKPLASCRRSRRRSSLCRGLPSKPSTSSCCGMAGSFGYGADTVDVSLKMGELSLFPAVRQALLPKPSWSPMARPAGIRSRTAPAATAAHVARVLAMSVRGGQAD